MKKSEIKIGKTYHNGKVGSFYSERKIIDEGPHLLLYSGQENNDCLRYQVVRGFACKGQGNITRQRFASWAKGEVKGEGE